MGAAGGIVVFRRRPQAKRACGELGRPYAVVGTAASMDGYTAFGASIAVDGYKQTLDCPAPSLAVADLDVTPAA